MRFAHHAHCRSHITRTDVSVAGRDDFLRLHKAADFVSLLSRTEVDGDSGRDLQRRGQVSVIGVWKFLRRYQETSTISRKQGSGRPSKITSAIEDIVERQMQLDDETTAVQLRTILSVAGHVLSLRTILRS